MPVNGLEQHYGTVACESEALHSAAFRFRKEATERLIADGADVNAKNARGRTPLHLAGMKGPEEKEVDQLMTAVARVLLAHGADVNALDKEGHTPLHYALLKDRVGVAVLLRRYGGID